MKRKRPCVAWWRPGGSISVDLSLDGLRLTLAVTDTGIGISAGDVKHLFQKFHQLEGSATRRFEGSGLGLALVKEFAELLGGTVRVASEPWKGSTFTVTLPLHHERLTAGAPLMKRSMSTRTSAISTWENVVRLWGGRWK